MWFGLQMVYDKCNHISCCYYYYYTIVWLPTPNHNELLQQRNSDTPGAFHTHFHIFLISTDSVHTLGGFLYIRLKR